MLGGVEISLDDNKDKLVMKQECVQKFKLDYVEFGSIELGIRPLNFGVAPELSRLSSQFKKSDSFRRSLLNMESDLLLESNDDGAVHLNKKAIVGWIRVKMLDVSWKRKIRPVLMLLQEDILVFTRLYFKGGVAVRVNQKSGPVEISPLFRSQTAPGVMPEVLFGETEGWAFNLPGQPKSKPRRFAADTKAQRDKWLAFMSGRYPKSRVSGFLWKLHDVKKEIKYLPNQKKEEWRRWYCIADEATFEWFSTGDIDTIPLKRVMDVTRHVRVGSIKVSKTSARSQLQHMDKHSFEFTLRDHRKEPVASFVTRTLDQCNSWIDEITNALEKDLVRESLVPGVDEDAGALTKLKRVYTMRVSNREDRKKSLASTESPFDTVITQSPDVEMNRTFRRDYVETPTTTKLRNKIREFVSKADQETGKTQFGNWNVDDKKPADGQFRLLSFDGGGFKTILQAVIMERLIEIFPDLLGHFDMFAGCSGGSVVATTLASGRSPLFLRELLETMDPLLVPKESARINVAGFGVKKAKYTHDRMFLFGAELFRDLTFRTMKKRLLITSFLLDNNEDDDKRTWTCANYHNIIQNFQHSMYTQPDPTPRNRSNTAETDEKPEVHLSISPPGGSPMIGTRGESTSARHESGSARSSGSSRRRSDRKSAHFHKKQQFEKEKTDKEEHDFDCSPPEVPSTDTTLLKTCVSPRFSNRRKSANLSMDTLEQIDKKDASSSPKGEIAPEDKGKERDNGSLQLNKRGQKMSQMLDLPVWEAIMYSSSAPTFFPSYKRHIDGGVVANNPTLAAVSEVMAVTALNPVPAQNLHVLSISCGTFRFYIDGDTHDWGILQWGPKLTDLLLRTGDAQTDMICDRLLGENYHRLAPAISRKLPMDDPAIVPELAKFAKEVDLTDTIKWIKKHIYNDEHMHTIADDNREKREGIRPAVRSSLSLFSGAPSPVEPVDDDTSSDDTGVTDLDSDPDQDEETEDFDAAEPGNLSRLTATLNLNWNKVWRAK
eukprot:TRINITY_DN5805_c0_g2_i3.p1 TRINITY_DN5805_c0_g2~~TRINITY_DN5805_c0_g2_i3.p1  ORF type:complete len:1000 (+),score=116.26 TRINITY_DN5805_c0_g2_i3:402-3401(+)